MTADVFSVFPTLTTPRLLLRELDPADAADVLVFRGDPEVQRFNSAPMTDIRQALALIDTLRKWYLAQKAIHWGVTLRGESRVIGLYSLHGLDRYHRRGALGYDLAREYWGQGIAQEAVGEIVRFAFEQLELNRLEAVTIADNYRSVSLLERLGFTLEGTRREHSLEDDGLFHSSAIYGLLRREYLAR
ncbi:MAG: GNAT family N-acetyltransferase [Chloroflexi bacterium]|nr:GNAT family N-acetyltransferase [Chloroflexota bacterium]